MATYRKSFDDPINKYNTKRRELAASMLEYSEHMRHVNKARGGYRHPDQADLGLPLDLEIRAHKQSLYRNDDLPHFHRRHNSNHFNHHHYNHHSRKDHHHNHHHHFDRPLSFNEKELQRNRNPDYHQRPRRDTKSERPIVIPNPGPDIPDTPEDTRQVKVNLLNAADLYELVDLDKETKNPSGSSTRIVNLEDGVQIIQDIELSSRSRKEDQKPKRQPDAEESKEQSDTVNNVVTPRMKQKKTIDVGENSCLLTGRAIKADVNKSKYRPKFNMSNRLNKESRTREPSLGDSKDRNDDDPLEDGVLALDLLLQAAAVQHTTSISNLQLRPKRAKRMMLHQPELLAIPEDGGSFIRTGNLDSARNRMLTSVPLPSERSLQALKGNNNYFGNRRVDNMADDEDYVARGSRTSHEPQIESENRRQRRSNRTSRGEINMDQITATSVYSGLARETEFERSLREAHDMSMSDRNSHKHRAQKKMKRLIFLRDQPEHYYRREM